MFKRLTSLAESVKKIDADILFNQFAKDENLKENMVQYNTIDQLFNLGIDSDGRTLGQYSASTIEGTKNYLGKKQKGQRFDHITLKDTGAFYDSFKVIPTQDGLLIVADSEKDDTNLRDTFGNEIIGLTDENFSKTVAEMRLKSILFIKNALNV